MPTKTFTYSVTANFGQTDHLGNPIKGDTTKSISWTIRSATAITGGTFLDGSPWVLDNGDLELINVSPAPEHSITSFSIKYPDGFTASDGIFRSNPTREIETRFWKNQTIINPDFGKIPSDWAQRVYNPYIHYNNSDETSGLTKEEPELYQRSYNYINPVRSNHPVNDLTNPIGDQYRRILTAGSLGTADVGGTVYGLYLNDPGLSAGSDIEPAYFFGFDGRAGNVEGGADNSPNPLPTQGKGKSPVGTFYNKTLDQIWNRAATSIEAGDVVVSCISHEDPYWAWGRNTSNRDSIIDMYGALTVISPDRESTASSRFRPPVNWDPSDKTNRPFYKERTLSSDLLIGKPDRGIDDNTATNPFTDVSLSDYFTDPVYGKSIRTGTVVPFIGDNEWDDTYQGYGRSFCRSSSEYGSDEGIDQEILLLLTMDSTIADADRTRYRRILAQRGLDLYGGIRSLGKHFGENGGHPEAHEYYIMAADMFAEPEGATAEVYNLEDSMNGIIGNTGNNTFKNFGLTLQNIIGWPADGATTGVSHLGIRGMSHYNQQILLFGSSAEFEFAARVTNAGISATGVTSSNGVDVPYIIVNPPKISTVSGTGDTGPNFDKSTDSLGFHGSLDTRRDGGSVFNEGRWANTANITYMLKENFNSIYIRKNSTGELAMCIGSEPQGPTADDDNGGRYQGAWYTDSSLKLFYTPGITFNAGETIDFCPMLEQDFNTARASFGTVGTIKNINPIAGTQQYHYSINRGLATIELYKRVLNSIGRPMPKLWQSKLKRAQGFITDSLVRSAYHGPQHNIPGTSYTVYSLNTPKSNYGELFKSYVRYLYTGTGAAAPLYETLDEKYNGFSGDVEGKTWISFDPNPNNPTVLIGDGNIPYKRNANKFWRTIDGTTAGELNRLRFDDYSHVSGNTWDAIYIESSLGRPLSYSQYVENKNLYIWISGRNSPISLDLVENNFTSDSSWNQKWSLPSNIQNLPKLSQLGYDPYGIITCFYADVSLDSTLRLDASQAAPSVSESLVEYGTANGLKAVGSINMLSRMYEPDTNVDVIVTADTVDPSDIKEVRLYSNGGEAVSTTRTKNANGVQGYQFTLNTGLTAGGTAGDPLYLYAKIIPNNGLERVVYKKFRVGNMTEATGLGITSGDAITKYLGYNVTNGGADRIGDGKYLSLENGTYYLEQETSDNTQMDWIWNEVRAAPGNDNVILVPRINSGATGHFVANAPNLRLSYCHFDNVKIDMGTAVKFLVGQKRGSDGLVDPGYNEHYVSFDGCEFFDSYGGVTGPAFGYHSSQLYQNLFDYTQSVIYEVHNTSVNYPVVGGGREYVNVNCNSSFDMFYIDLFERPSGIEFGNYPIIEQGFCVNKVTNDAGTKKFWQRAYLYSTGVSGGLTQEYLTIEGVTFDGSNTIVSFGQTADWGNLDTYTRTDYMLGWWTNGSEVNSDTRIELEDRLTKQWGPTAGAPYGSTGDVLIMYSVDHSSSIPTGVTATLALWAHPDGFQFGAPFQTGVTVDQMVLHDYRLNYLHQPFLVSSGDDYINTVVLNNCSFEHPATEVGNYQLQGQYTGKFENVAFKNSSLATIPAISWRDSSASYYQPSTWRFYGCLLPQLSGDAGATNDFSFVEVVDSVYRNLVRVGTGGATGATFSNSIQLPDSNWDLNVDINGVGAPIVGSSADRSPVSYSSLPYDILGVTKDNKIGPYNPVGSLNIGFSITYNGYN